MLAGLLIGLLSILGGNYKYMRRNACGLGIGSWSVHELDQPHILELGPKSILDFSLVFGTDIATCRLVFFSAAASRLLPLPARFTPP